MAKSDIPFDMFFEKYFPEDRHGEHIDTVAQNEYFDVMERITLEDLQSLTPEELNCIPMSWLYDWHHCKAHYFAKGEPEKFIDNIYKKREEHKKIDTYLQVLAYAFSRERKQFTAKEVLAIHTEISFEEFLKIAYFLITHGFVRFKDGLYTVIKQMKFYP